MHRITWKLFRSWLKKKLFKRDIHINLNLFKSSTISKYFIYCLYKNYLHAIVFIIKFKY